MLIKTSSLKTIWIFQFTTALFLNINIANAYTITAVGCAAPAPNIVESASGGGSIGSSSVSMFGSASALPASSFTFSGTCDFLITPETGNRHLTLKMQGSVVGQMKVEGVPFLADSSVTYNAYSTWAGMSVSNNDTLTYVISDQTKNANYTSPQYSTTGDPAGGTYTLTYDFIGTATASSGLASSSLNDLTFTVNVSAISQ